MDAVAFGVPRGTRIPPRVASPLGSGAVFPLPRSECLPGARTFSGASGSAASRSSGVPNATSQRRRRPRGAVLVAKQ